MVKLFITDLDGCLSVPFQTPDWELITEIRSLNSKSAEDESIPPLTICSGRPAPYVEAVAQWLDINLPVVFESAGMFHPRNNQVTMNAIYDEQAAQDVKALQQWLKKEIISQTEGMLPEFAKVMDAGLIHPRKEVIQKVLPEVAAYVAAHYNHFEVHWTDVSINIILKNNNKKTGIADLCTFLDISPEEVAYIGDSSGDIPGLELVGWPYAPANAAEEVKKVARVIPKEATKAVVAAYQEIIEHNREKVAS